MRSRITRAIGPAAMVIAVAIALFLLERELKAYHYRDLMRQVWTLPHTHLALALLLTAIAYAVLPGYDAIALAYVDHSLPLRRIAFGSFIAYALSHSLGFPLLSGGPVRYRFWSVWGLSTSGIAQAISFAAATFVIGMIAVAGFVFVLEPTSTIQLLRLPFSSLKPLGALCLVLVAAYLVLSATRYKTFNFFDWEFPVPSTRLALALLIAFEVQRQRERVAEVASLAGGLVGRWLPTLLPQILSVATFSAGVILIVSGATPAVRSRVTALDSVLPLGVIEISHFAA